jgi:dTDP-4-dehydrorhamnose reductase
MKILLTGASGLLGHNFAKLGAKRGHQIHALYHRRKPTASGLCQSIQMDLQAPDNLTQLCLELWPDAIVNCAAISSPADCERLPDLAEKINVALPQLLAQISTHIGARLIHISTDLVFDGLADQPYRSTDLPNPRSLYGQCKLMAERAVLEHNPEDPVVLRVPLLMGKSPSQARSVHEKLLLAVQSGEVLKVSRCEWRQPAAADNVAAVMLELCERRDLHGLFHWAGSERLNRLEIAQRILEHFNYPIDAVEAVDSPGADTQRLFFNLEPLVNKIKTRPQNFQAQLEALTRIQPLNAEC